MSWVLKRCSDTFSQDLRASVRKCFALSPILLSTGTACSDLDDASYDASFRSPHIGLTEACSVSQSQLDNEQNEDDPLV